MSGLTFQSSENERYVGNIQWDLVILNWVLSPIYFTNERLLLFRISESVLFKFYDESVNLRDYL